MISVICACNNKKVLQDMLISSLDKQTFRDYELIVVDAKEKGFKSAAETLNYGASVARGDILLFIHQDITLLNDDFLTKLNDYCNRYKFGVGGVAGVPINEKEVYSTVKQESDWHNAGKVLTQPMLATTLDECAFFVKKPNFKCFSNLGKSWHMYAVEYCIQCTLLGESIYLFPLEVYHLSGGCIDKSYWDTLKNLANMYKGKIKCIHTIFGNFKNNWFSRCGLYGFYRRTKHKVKLFLCKIIGKGK